MTNVSRRKFLQLGGITGAAMIAAALGGCSQGGSNAGNGSNASADGGSNANSNASAGSTSTSSAASTGGKTLVAYYSAQGHTKRVAKAVADELEADIFEIVPQDPYSDAGLDWTDDSSRVNIEHNDESKRDVPLKQAAPENFDSYDRVILGYPIWWAVAAWPTDHFVIDNNFEGKEVITFCTSTSSGLGQSTDLLADAAGSGNWEDGMRFSSGASDSDVREWAKSLN